MDGLRELFIVLLMILASPFAARVARIPVIVVEILLGMALGPGGLGVVWPDGWVRVMAEFGFIYLMFLAGMEIELEALGAQLRRVAAVSMSSLLPPLLLGVATGIVFGVSPLLLGLAISTTSMGIVLPIARELGGRRRVAQVLLGSAVLVDVLSMLGLAIVVEERVLNPGNLALMLGVATGFAAAFYAAGSPRVQKHVLRLERRYHLDVRLSLALIFGFAILAEYMGIHAIIGSFFAGLLLSRLFGDHERVVEKLLGFGYGFFLPIFFIDVGLRTDLVPLLGNIEALELLAALFAAGYGVKAVGTALVSRAVGFGWRESVGIGFAMSARLSLIVAAAEIGLAQGLFTHEVFSILVLLAVFSVLASPMLTRAAMGVGHLAEEELV